MKKITNRPGHVAFIGFGEAATAFLSGWDENRPEVVSAYDIKTDTADTRDEMLARFGTHGVSGGKSASDALAGAEAVFCVVTADQALVAAETAAASLQPGTVWFDCNSCSPGTKSRAAEVIGAAGGLYVDVAVMAPVYPKQHHVPLLVSGPDAERGEAILLSLDMKPTIAGPNVGQASSIKMLRSVMIKGMEALVAECFLSARRAGVEAEVLASFEASDPDIAWRKRGAYNLERMMVHGLRRSAEMREVALTVQELGLGGAMSAATADWEERIGSLRQEPGEDDLFARADLLLARL